MGARFCSGLLAATLLVLPGCVTKQRVSLECVPREVTVYVDGRVLETVPEALELRVDEPHTIYFKGGGYRTQMLVFESEEVDGKPRLSPPDVCTQTTFAELQPEVEIEVEREAAP